SSEAAKSGLVDAIAATATPTPLGLVRVKVFAALGLSTGWLPKASLAGESATSNVPVPLSAAVSAGPPVAIVSLPRRAPTPARRGGREGPAHDARATGWQSGRTSAGGGEVAAGRRARDVEGRERRVGHGDGLGRAHDLQRLLAEGQRGGREAGLRARARQVDL